MKVKLVLLRHLPLLVYGAKDPVYHGDMATGESMQQAGAKIKGLVSSGEASGASWRRKGLCICWGCLWGLKVEGGHCSSV
jgi:hypothetical protein